MPHHTHTLHCFHRFCLADQPTAWQSPFMVMHPVLDATRAARHTSWWRVFFFFFNRVSFHSDHAITDRETCVNSATNMSTPSTLGCDDGVRCAARAVSKLIPVCSVVNAASVVADHGSTRNHAALLAMPRAARAIARVAARDGIGLLTDPCSSGELALFVHTAELLAAVTSQ